MRFMKDDLSKHVKKLPLFKYDGLKKRYLFLLQVGTKKWKRKND